VVTHRVGVFSRSRDFGRGDDALAKWTAHLAELPQRAKLGELFCYSWDFQLTGRVIEVLTGKTYEAAMRDLVLEPLGMTHSCFFATDAITHRVAAGHDVKEGVAQVTRPWPEIRSGHPSGGMLSTANDLARFMRLHLGMSKESNRVLSDTSVAFMASPVSPDGTNGVTWWRHRVAGLDVIEHAGGYPGFLGEVALIPARNFGIAVLTNITRSMYEHRFPEINTVSGKIIAWALDAYLDVRVPADAPLPLSEQELASYVGTYVGESGNLDLSMGDGCLVATERPTDPAATAPDPYRLAFYGTDKFFVLDGDGKDARGQFVRDAKGDLTWFRPFVPAVYRRNSALRR
jgi:CubicO group peptidase (beta-lactamase class C family)